MPIALPLLAAAALSGGAAQTVAKGPLVVPTIVEAGHFYAMPETVDGQRPKLLVDTGGGGTGGMYLFTDAEAKRLHLDVRDCANGGGHAAVASLPRYKSGMGLPAPLPGPCGRSVLIIPADQSGGLEGQLGSGYLPGRVWTFDYPARKLIREGARWHPEPAAHSTALGFPRDAKGKPASGFPRITIRVDGQPVDMLLDTGATAHPTAAGKQASGTPTKDGFGVTSYIASSMVDRWHKAHPKWRVVEKGDDLRPAHATRIIEVPAVEVAGWTVGPVWFTEQSDYAYHVYMASMMDKPVEGALGGNVFGHFAMTLDYPGATAWFRCVTGCRAATH